MTTVHQEGHHAQNQTTRVSVSTVNVAGKAKGQISVTCGGQTHQFDTDQVAGVHVRREGNGGDTVEVHVSSSNEGTSGQQSSTAHVSQTIILG